MRFILRLLMTLVGIVAFFAMVAFGGFYAYGQYGAPLIQEQLQKAEDQIEEDLEEEYPGAEVTVTFNEVFYNNTITELKIAFEVHAIAELANVEVENTTQYAVVGIVNIIMGNGSYESYDETEWEDIEADYSVAPAILFDSDAAKQFAMTYLIVSGAVFVGSIVVKIVFLRKKRLA